MTTFYICPHCGNIVEMVHDAHVVPHCCGQKMDRLMPNTVEASGEKHVPAVIVTGDAIQVHVGTVNHPMAQEHWISWIALETSRGNQRKYLKPGEAPKAVFALAGEEPVAVYAYCNLHGLWKTEVN